MFFYRTEKKGLSLPPSGCMVSLWRSSRLFTGTFLFIRLPVTRRIFLPLLMRVFLGTTKVSSPKQNNLELLQKPFLSEAFFFKYH